MRCEKSCPLKKKKKKGGDKYARGIDLMFLFAQSHPDGGFFLCNTPTPPFPIPIPILTMPCDAVVVFVLSFKNIYRSLYLGSNKRFPHRTDCGSLGNPAAKKFQYTTLSTLPAGSGGAAKKAAYRRARPAVLTSCDHELKYQMRKPAAAVQEC